MEITGAPSIVHCRRKLEKGKVISVTHGLPWCVLWAQGWAAAWRVQTVTVCDSSMGLTELSLIWGKPQLALVTNALKSPRC